MPSMPWKRYLILAEMKKKEILELKSQVPKSNDDPPYLAVGTDVSAKYKGAFCEAKIRKISRHVKCKVTFKSGLGLAPATIPDDQIRGTLRVGQVVEARPDKDKNTYYEATINRIQDSSMYTVVFDDGDITTLRRSALCLKSGRHFNESETLDQLPLTHPEHFLNPVVGGRRGGRRRTAKNDADKDDSSDEEDTPSQKGKKNNGTHIAPGRVVYVENAEKKKGKDHWFPGLIVSPCAQDTVKIRVKDECLVRSFKDGRYYTVPKKEITEFSKEQHGKWDSISNPLKAALEKAIAYLDKDELPPHWDRDVLFGDEEEEEEDESPSDAEGLEARQQEENDLFLANLHRFHEEAGTPFTKPPSICNKELDLGKLFKLVTDQGGHDKITNGGQWKNVTMKLGLGNMPSTSTVNLVKKNYKRFLYDFEKSADTFGLSQQSSGSTSKVRLSRSQNRIAMGSLSSSKDSVRKEETESSLKSLDDGDTKKSTVVEPEGDTASVDSTDTKKSEASSATNEEPRRSRSRQESRSLVKKESSVITPDEKNTTEGKKKTKKNSAKEKDKEETLSIKAEPPSPAPSSQGSKKGRGGSRKKKDKEDEDVTKEIPKVDESVKSEGLSKDIKIQVGDKLSVFYPNGDQPMTYEAKVIEMCPNRGYLVHYTGWNTRYDEWIKRNRISENLSLRANYQAKSQGKGPASSTSGTKDKEKDKEVEVKVESETPVGKAKSGKKKGRTTPAPSLSSTGTRSKSGTVKRKRMSAEFEEPAKKKRMSKKNEKDAAQSGSESESSDTEMKPEKITKPLSSTAAQNQSRVVKSQKEKKAIEEASSDVRVVIKDEENLNITKPTSGDSVETNQPNQSQPTEVVDMAQIRSEMRGLPNIVKSKSASSIPSSTSGPCSLSQSTSSSVSVKLDIYDFEEEVTDAPKLKMFSPRSPDKKDDGTSKPVADPASSKTQVTDTTKLKDASSVPAQAQSAAGQAAAMVKVEPGTSKVVTAKSIAPIPVSPKTSSSPIQTQGAKTLPGMTSNTTPPAISQARGLLAVSSAATPGQRIIAVGASALTIPQHRPRPPMSAAPSSLAPSVGLTATARPVTPPVMQGVGPSAGMPVHPLVPQSSVAARLPKIPPGKPVLKPKPGFAPSCSQPAVPETTSIKDVNAVKDVKVLPPFQHKAHEVFPHLIKQEKISTGPHNTEVSGQASESTPQKIQALPSAGKSEKYVGAATVLNIPSVKPMVKVSTPEITKPEKQKRGGAKLSAAAQPQLIPTVSLTSGPEFQQNQKKAKPEIIKPASSPYPALAPKPSLLQKSEIEIKKEVKAQGSEALLKINDTISNLMQTTEDKPTSSGKKKKQEKVADEKVVTQKETKEKEGKTKQDSPTAKPSDKRSSPIKTHFLKDSGVGQPEKSSPTKQDNLITSKTSVVIQKMKLDPRQTESLRNESLKLADNFSESRSSTVIVPFEKTVITEVKSGRSVDSHSILQISKLSTAVESSAAMTQSPSSSKFGAKTGTGQALSLQIEKSPVGQLGVTEPPKHEIYTDIKSKSIPEAHLTRIKLESNAANDITESQEITCQKAYPSAVKKEPSSSLESTRTSKIDDSSKPSTALSATPKQVESEVPVTDIKVESGKAPEVDEVRNQQDVIPKDEKESERPLTPSFLTAKEELAPDFEDEPVLPKQRSSRRESAAGLKFSDSSKEDESCSSLLCEEEIPGSPTADDDARSKFDFVDDEDSKQEKPSLRDPSRSEKASKSESSKDGRKPNRRDFTSDEALSAMEKEFHGPQEHSSPSTPESISMSVETGGSPNIDGRGISPSGGGSSKSKESTDGESHSGDGSKSYFGEDAHKKVSSPAIKRAKDSRSRLSSPPPKRRRIPRKKSPEEVSRTYHRGRGSSSRKSQPVGSETPEAVRIPLPPPPPFAPLVRPQVQAKWEHLIPNLDGVTDSEERALIIYNCMMKAKEKYLEIRAQEQARERRLKRLRRKERERAAAEKQALKSQEVRVAQ